VPAHKKLAQSCDLSLKKVEEAVQQMGERGWGQHLSRRTLKIFEAQALQYCDTDSEEDAVDKEYEQIQANISLSNSERLATEAGSRTPERIIPEDGSTNSDPNLNT